MTACGIKRAIKKACPDAEGFEIDLDNNYANFRSWSFSKEPEDANFEEEEREGEMIAKLRRTMPGWSWYRGEKNYFEGERD